MTTMNYIGLDVHKKTISYCVKDAAGQVLQEGKVGSTRRELDCWIKTVPHPRTIAMEATIFTGWIYDHLFPHAEKVKVAHPLMLRAIAAAKKKNDTIDAGKIADCLRCDFLPECPMVSTEIRERRRILRYRHLLVRQMVQMKNRVSGLLMETGVEHHKQRLHKVGYFHELLSTNQEVPPCIRPLLKISRERGSSPASAPGGRIAPQQGQGGTPQQKAAGGVCFVATAAFGDPNHPDVAYLRPYRDEMLSRHKVGHNHLCTHRAGPREDSR
jgi:Transposase